MSNKGIVIDVGFKGDITDFINKIQSDFEKIDFSDSIGLSDAFEKQAKEVKKQLVELKAEIDKTINGKTIDPSKQIQELRNNVNLLAKNFKILVTSMSGVDTSKFDGELSSIIANMSELSDTCNGAVNVISELQSATRQGVKFVDKEQVQSLKTLLTSIEKVEQAYNNINKTVNKKKNTPFEDSSDVVEVLEKQYRLYADLESKRVQLEDKDELTEKERVELDQLNVSLTETCINLTRLINTFEKLKGNKKVEIEFGEELLSISSIEEEVKRDINDLIPTFVSIKDKIRDELNSLGELNVTEEISKELHKDKNKITVPISISTRVSTLTSEAIALIQQVQEKVTDNPLEVEVKLLSSYKTKSNQSMMKQIQEQLSYVEDEEIKGNIQSLIDKMNVRLDNALLFNVKVNTESANLAVKEFVRFAKEELNSLAEHVVPLEPEVILTEEHKQAFQKQINEAKGDFKIQVGILDGENTVDQNATKKELTYLKNLKKYIENVEVAVNNKTLAFIDEEGVVSDVIKDERTYLNQLYSDLILIEEQVKEICNQFKLLPEALNVRFDDNVLESLSKLFDNKALKKIGKAKDTISTTLAAGFINDIEIPKESKIKLLNDIDELSKELNTIFQTKGLENWHNEFTNALNDISSKIKNLFGNNALNDMIKQWNMSDEHMIEKVNRNHIKERSAVLVNGKLYNSATHDQAGSTRFLSTTIREVLQKVNNIQSMIGIHSHGSDRIVASSLPQGKDISGDLNVFYQQFKQGVEKQLTIALNDIELFDAKGFFESNKSVDFNSFDIREKISNKRDEISKETNKYFYQYFDRFIDQYSIKDKNGILNSLFDSNILNYSIDNKKIIDALKAQTNGIDLESEFLKYLKTSTIPDINLAFKNFLASQFKFSSIDFKSLGIDDSAVNDFKVLLTTIIRNTGEKIIKQAYGLDEKFEINKGRDLSTFNFRQITPRILEEALKGTGYKNNYQDFMKSYTTKEFIKQNPLGLSSGILSDMFNTSAPTAFLEILDKIVADIKEIKDATMGNILKDAFNIKIDENSLQTFVSEINRLIESIEKLPKIITDAFSNFESVMPKDPITAIDKEIQKLSDDITETENRIKELESQLSGTNNISLNNSIFEKQNIIQKDNNAQQNNNTLLEEELEKLKKKHELLLKQIELLQEQKKLLLDNSKQDTTNGIDSKINAFKQEGTVVDIVINSEINKLDELEKKLGKVTEAVNAKTEAFKNEGKVVGEVTGEEISNLNPLQNLESTYNLFKPFYDNNDFESEEGAKAALSYYNAYKEALISKVNKKDLKQYTIGKESDLFTGNYTNYKKGIGELDLSGLNGQIEKYSNIIEKLNQPEVINIINALSEAIRKLLSQDNVNNDVTKLLEQLNKTINNLGGNKSADKIERITKNLENLQKSINTLDISDSGFIQSLSSILEKGAELKALGEVLKSTKKQIDDAEKAIKAESNLKQAQNYLDQYKNDITTAVNNKYGEENVLYQQLQATKDGIIQVTAMVKEGEDTYKKYVLTTTNGSDLMIKAINDNAAALSKEVKQWQAYQKLKSLAVPGAKNLGIEGVSFTPESNNWDQLVDKAHEFGIEVKDVERIVRNVDEIGQESFQIFTKLSRITIGMDSNGVLFQKDEVLDKNKALTTIIANVERLRTLMANSITTKNDISTESFVNIFNEISSINKEVDILRKKRLISDEEIEKLERYFDAFGTTIQNISIDKIDTNRKTNAFIQQVEEAKQSLSELDVIWHKMRFGEQLSDEDILKIKEYVTQIRDLNEIAKDKSSKTADTGTMNKTLTKIAKNLEQNSNMSNELKRRFRELANEIQSFGDNIPADKMKEFTDHFEQLNREMWQSGKTGLSFFDGIMKRAKSMSQSFISMYLSLWDIVRYIRTGVTYIKDLDTALTEMRKVSDESVSSLKEFQKVSFDIAGTVGTTAKQIQNSTADWMRLGETLDEAQKSAKVANILLNVSEFSSIDEATESLVSMSAAYDELDKMDIIDKLNEVGNNYSISTNGLATALQRSASALKTAGNDMNEAVALITAGNAVVQDADSVGTGMQTIALRLTGKMMCPNIW